MTNLILLLLLLACHDKTPGVADSGGRGDTGAAADTAGPDDTGSAGDTGSPGDTGSAGDTGKGDTGSAGDTGKGDTGGGDTGGPYVAPTLGLDDATWAWYGAAGNQLGYSVAFAGDTNGDGEQEMLVSAPDQGLGVGTDGHFELVTLGSGGSSARVATLSLQLHPAAGTNVGLAAGGDLNGDGYDDIAIGDYDENYYDYGVFSGAVAVFLGPVSGTLNQDDADYIFSGLTYHERFGRQVAFVPNPTDPARVSLLVSAPAASGTWAAYLWVNPSESGTEETADASLQGAGWGAQSAGDVDGDGIEDLLTANLGSEGRVYVVSGPFASEVDLASSAPALVGEDTSAETGDDVAAAGDVNGDGYDDILIGDAFDDEVGDRAGKAWIVHGPVTATMSLSDADARLLGESDHDEFGFSVAALGDANGDGSLDIAVGAPRPESYRPSYPGKVYVFSAPLSGTISAGHADLVIVGRERGDLAGAYMDGGRDIDGDGNPDLLVAAPDSKEGAPMGGEVDLLTGLSW